jgi:hypothetical protein
MRLLDRVEIKGEIRHVIVTSHLALAGQPSSSERGRS